MHLPRRRSIPPHTTPPPKKKYLGSLHRTKAASLSSCQWLILLQPHLLVDLTLICCWHFSSYLSNFHLRKQSLQAARTTMRGSFLPSTQTLLTALPLQNNDDITVQVFNIRSKEPQKRRFDKHTFSTTKNCQTLFGGKKRIGNADWQTFVGCSYKKGMHNFVLLTCHPSFTYAVKHFLMCGCKHFKSFDM